MDRALYLAMSGAKQDMYGMQVHANNLANVSTTGFRADLQQARSMQAYGEGLPSRVFSMAERPGNDFAQGSVINTGRDLDVAVEGDGWLAVMDVKGQEAYTRAGHLKIDQTGMLQNSNGQLVLGQNDSPIFIPLPISKIEIGKDGTVSVLPQGAPPDAMAVVDRIKLVKPDRAIYQLAISRFNLYPKETVFIDDKLENIKTAKKLNFKTIFLDDPHKIKIEINKFIN